MSTASELFIGMDLHGDNVFCSIMNAAREPLFDRKLPNDLEQIVEVLAPLRSRIRGMAVESTYNWYWLVDGLRAKDFEIKLANPARMQENIGLKSANDKTDARFIARQLAMGTLPEGFIYPEETRGVRDLMRRRIRLVQARTREWLSLECLVARHTGKQLNTAELQTCEIATMLDGYATWAWRTSTARRRPAHSRMDSRLESCGLPLLESMR